jgi:ATP-dependent DNA helicase RecQ
MRNQIAMAEKIGIRAHTINSSNRKEWTRIEKILAENACDILLISPERLNNPRFRENVLRAMAGRVGLLVVDEAHCISDWGHDFRPDYQRITRILKLIPKRIPILCTTATANDRVIADIKNQLGEDLVISRGPLSRKSLRLQALKIPDQASRMAWLSKKLPLFSSSGIIYCLTTHDADRVAAWLQYRGHEVKAYHARLRGDVNRVTLEEELLNNEIKALVATTALGMGFDKPDLGFVIHFQCPGSVIAYYQQVGRAGRELEKAYGILLSGEEDHEIQDYFINSAFPDIGISKAILEVLEEEGPLGMYDLLTHVNVRQSTADKALKILELEGAVGVEYDPRKKFFRTPNPWQPDVERMERVTAQRRQEQEEMHTYLDYDGCLMNFLCDALDDPEAEPCGKCANCVGKGFSIDVNPQLIAEAVSFLRSDHLFIKPRKQWPRGILGEQRKKISVERQLQEGRSLCAYGDSGWGKLVRKGKYEDNYFSDELVKASAELINEIWQPDPFPAWLTSIPSLRRPELVPSFASRLAKNLKIPYIPIIKRDKNAAEQKTMENSTMAVRNVLGTLRIEGQFKSTPVLLVDDIVDSRWSLTVAGYLLLKQGSGPVFPFTLASAQGRTT